MRVCNFCEYNDGLVYTSMPPCFKCTVTGEFHGSGHACDVEFVPIVRCKDCDRSGKDSVGQLFCRNDGREINPEGYCNNGRKK